MGKSVLDNTSADPDLIARLKSEPERGLREGSLRPSPLLPMQLRRFRCTRLLQFQCSSPAAALAGVAPAGVAPAAPRALWCAAGACVLLMDRWRV